MLGNTANRDIQRFYSENYISAFISLSSTEGVPVSFTEALSYGIPIFATDVGGNGELVNDSNGYLTMFNNDNTEGYLKDLKALLNSELDKENIANGWRKKFNIETNNLKILEAEK